MVDVGNSDNFSFASVLLNNVGNDGSWTVSSVLSLLVTVVYAGFVISGLYKHGVQHLPQARPFELLFAVLEAAMLIYIGVEESRPTKALNESGILLLASIALFSGANIYVCLLSARKLAGLMTRFSMLTIVYHYDSPRYKEYLMSFQLLCLMLAVLIGEGDTCHQFGPVPCKDLDFVSTSMHENSVKKVSVLTMGSRGDVQPFIALGQALEKRGVKVVISTMDRYKPLVERYGLEFHPCGLEEIAHNDQIWRTATHVAEVIGAAREGAVEHYGPVSDNFLKACKGCDVILATAVTVSFGLNIAEHMKVPCWIVKLSPDTPTRSFSPPSHVSSNFGIVNLMRWYAHWARIFISARNGVSMKAENPENTFRQDVLGLEPLGGGKRLRQMGAVPTLCAFSQAIVPKPSDWPVNVQVTGWWFVCSSALNSSINKNSGNPELDAFLAKDGKKPICVNFGSMSEVAKDFGVVKKVIEALSLGENKVVLIDPTLKEETLEQEREIYLKNAKSLDLFMLKEIPHDFVFPKCSLVIHHGGAGTTARVLQFGLPAVIIPIMLWTDQPLWADRLQTLNAAVYLDRRSDSLVEQVSLACTKIETDESMSRAASKLGLDTDQEGQGIDQSVELILGRSKTC